MIMTIGQAHHSFAPRTIGFSLDYVAMTTLLRAWRDNLRGAAHSFPDDTSLVKRRLSDEVAFDAELAQLAVGEEIKRDDEGLYAERLVSSDPRITTVVNAYRHCAQLIDCALHDLEQTKIQDHSRYDDFGLPKCRAPVAAGPAPSLRIVPPVDDLEPMREIPTDDASAAQAGVRSGASAVTEAQQAAEDAAAAIDRKSLVPNRAQTLNSNVYRVSPFEIQTLMQFVNAILDSLPVIEASTTR